jgi:hypothetical protein
VLALLSLELSGCSKTSPLGPDGSRSFLGTWTGAITSDAIGTGTAEIIVDSQRETPLTPLLSGTWSFSFPNQAFSAKGTLTGSLNIEKTILGLTFVRPRVPCPGEPGGMAERTMFASMTVTGDRMRGAYIVVALGCPGGTIDLIWR